MKKLQNKEMFSKISDYKIASYFLVLFIIKSSYQNQ